MPRRQWRRTYRQLRSPLAWRIRMLFWGGAVSIGVIATMLAIASDQAGIFVRHVNQTAPWAMLFLSPAGLLAIVWLTRRFFPAAEGSGIPQAIAMLDIPNPARRKAVLGLGVGLFKAVMIVLGLACGASIGREGPTVHVAAAISYSLSRFGRFPGYVSQRGLILAGSAAGLSAAFNTPLAGIVFAIEEMSRSFEARTTGVVFMGVIVAGMTALVLQGNYAYFGSVSAHIETLDAVKVIVLGGIAGGVLGGAFSAMLVYGGRRLGSLRRRRPYLFALVCGLLIAALGLASGGLTYGTGYEQARQALAGTSETGPLYPFLKLAATVVSYLSGIPGGIFAPSLSAGATLGAELARWLPSTPASAVALLGMGGYFAGVVQSPVTTVVIIMEMTDEQSMLLPLMATALLAQWASKHICPVPIYHALATDFLDKERGRN